MRVVAETMERDGACHCGTVRFRVRLPDGLKGTRRRSNPNFYGINAACLKGVSPFDFAEVPVVDGINHPRDRVQPAPDIVGYLRYERAP